jgi:hypothetical protein
MSDLRYWMSLQRTIILALAFAAVTCFVPFAFAQSLDVAFRISPVTSLAWAITVGYAFVKYRWRGWPTILGAPLLLWWPFVLIGAVYVCAHAGACL